MPSQSNPRPRRAFRCGTALVLAVCALGGLLTSCGSGASVTIYSGRSEDLVMPILERFAEETGISVDVRWGDSAELALQVTEEGDATPADVFLSQSPGALGLLDEEGLLAELPTETLDLVEEQNRASDGSWVGVSGRKRVLVYNRDLVDEADLPESVLDLTDPAYRGMVAVAPENASFQDFVTGMRTVMGDDETLAWLEGMAANDVQTEANNNAIVEAVSRGEIPMGLVNHYYNYRFLEEDPSLPSVNYDFSPDDIGSMMIVTGAAVIEGHDTPEAQQLVEFLLADEAQEFFTNETFEYPLAIGSEPADMLPPLEEGFTLDTIDLDELGGDLETTVELIEQSGING
ncbi:MAG: Fe(3+)-binding periplasmic protein [Acidimicrobiales bacterium]|nr:MAG: extracellular solute-binding protein [Actinomycetota bacterium]MBV6508556.1 Fe(3+)-binding periplasmic protein [Acidimicrobiales bacterium]RIK05131.1 MAG: iron ABC transporter substrate-binding protein [Acidobacteriota bacterium]